MKEDAPENMSRVPESVTLDISQEFNGWLKEVACQNMRLLPGRAPRTALPRSRELRMMRHQKS